MQEIKGRGKIQVTVRRGVLPQACSCSYLLVRVVALGADKGIPIALILSHHRVQLAELVVAEILPLLGVGDMLRESLLHALGAQINVVHPPCQLGHPIVEFTEPTG